ncbi:uncharacterized protein K489DRAFT_380434 [Dissoconium aciculare CBS 342.82]|uniref:Methylated-DNA--protein-cysteine methyltransferase n=1 Tax=Dissoconium aciculare CBS 342.82 TaxID=1314786 RepID=A0A6J3M694_9PEZI|nr:uncharacterized protein K489DRAFT_380434 [Dissoconium aciculare CBS 342.82]KAF1823039.1 hypothetical protein K489DRAFT_380434 [Dissoconium aciculare CBS 342.82]
MTKSQQNQESNSGETADLEDLRSQWTHLYHDFLPSMAKSKDPAQPHWPVQLDHCFARIVLDNVIGKGSQPWTDVLGKPAVRNMSSGQLREVIALAEKIADGKVDLVELDEASLSARGKASKTKRKRGESDGEKGGSYKKSRPSQDVPVEDGGQASREVKSQDFAEAKHKGSSIKQEQRPQLSGRRANGTVSSYFQPASASSTSEMPDQSNGGTTHETELSDQDTPISLPSFLSTRSTSHDTPAETFLPKIAADKTLTPFRKQTLSLLCGVPRGRWTTYGAMSNYINDIRRHEREASTTNEKTDEDRKSGDDKNRTRRNPTNPAAVAQSVAKMTCARAVGNAMRNNPFAPGVPCHRVLAGDGSLGGFGGEWGEEGKFAGEKRRLLREEGVRFDGKGRATGEPWKGWTEGFAMV